MHPKLFHIYKKVKFFEPLKPFSRTFFSKLVREFIVEKLR
jgi:hypothetical protein